MWNVFLWKSILFLRCKRKSFMQVYLWIFLFYFDVNYEIYPRMLSFIVIVGANFLFSIPFHWSFRNHRKHSISGAESCQMDQDIRTLRYAVSWLELRYPGSSALLSDPSLSVVDMTWYKKQLTACPRCDRSRATRTSSGWRGLRPRTPVSQTSQPSHPVWPCLLHWPLSVPSPPQCLQSGLQSQPQPFLLSPNIPFLNIV